MKVHELECFLAVVDHGSITRAASALYLAQPSVSQIIRRLEAELSIELFRRVGRGLVLTPAGEALVGPARQVVRDLQHARQVADEYRGLERGRVDLAISASLTSNFLAAWVGHFRRKHPGLTVRITQHHGDTDDIVALIRSGEAELAYTVSPVSRQGIDCVHVGDGEVVLALPPGWRTEFPDPVPIRMLDGLPMVVDRGFGRSYLQSIRDATGVEPTVVVDVSESAGLVHLIVAGAGAAFLPMRQALDARRRGANLRMIDPLALRPIYAIMPSSPMSAPARKFLELSRENLDRWRRAVARRTGQGRSLLEASVEADSVIEAAYQRLGEEKAEPGNRTPAGQVDARR
ncbi:DNA-binding transcriptional LysR family regulator [Prauserella shujinwangii]|uniref:DNA-binding transcriptional LysR family regulator n=1 Tax=Prauserella shujinwangii TaxID=1453103 RepID=A0A2T0LSN3_9PSEU|nr:LysR family transcriptional regulator [Prauserella shujinwangii]PRX46680.1 DNA-binding transcriptional LysR family regulator [Prauserella shujinwangii]